MAWTFDSTVVTMDSDEYTMDGSAPDEAVEFDTFVVVQQTVVLSGGRLVIAKE